MRKEVTKTSARAKADEDSLKRKKWLLIGLAILVLILLIALPIVNYYLSIGEFVDTDGTVYSVKPEDGKYIILRPDGTALRKTPDEKYYYSDAGNCLSVGDDGYVKIVAVVEPEDGELKTDYVDTRVLMYEYIDSELLDSIEVVNEHGRYKFLRNSKGNLYIDGFETTAYNTEKFAYLMFCTGYTLSIYNIDKETLAKYGPEEYGITDDSAYFVIGSKSGRSYKVKVGDEVPTGDGYYVQLEGREKVYVLSSYIAETVLRPIEELLEPQIYFPMSITTYNNVKNFTVYKTRFDEEGAPLYSADGKLVRDVKVSFSYVDIEERRGTYSQTIPFEMVGGPLEGYTPSTNNVMTALRSIFETKYIGTKKLGIDDEALKKYGLDAPAYSLYYIYYNEVKEVEDDPSTVKNEEVTATYKYKHNVSISKKTEDGTYYAYSDVYISRENEGYVLAPAYHQIVEIDANSLLFLEWEDMKWIEPSYDQIMFDHIENIKLESPSYTVNFDFNHTRAYDKEEDEIIVKSTTVIATDKNGEHKLDDKSYGADPSETLLMWFKYFCSTRTSTTIIEEANLTDEQFDALKADESNLLLTITIECVDSLDDDGYPKEYKTKTFKFYKYNELKACISIDDSTPFLVIRDRVDLLIENAEKAVNGETISKR